ncbi:PEP-CTERM protein-sorting domain-containing protein [Desulfacinum infernum DSM 9756]|uniref:PEP-CTERM protein-sorting domain-containing protein n=1 Tax=Desulfacinum infernum DSM 9756 TaxID=1121391 RepID=A0A1M4UKF4_9BACT|nr:choice-of-anchor N protein [Desulfacinum infernum]SHE57216.1 PEP-CTERM protein-sorting domain-containing protein [Desulfacinum infernum DSM 9756]
MKQAIVKIILLIAVLVVVAPADAVPNLQIYIPGASYDEATETWIINSLEYDLWVVGANQDIFDVKAAFAAPVDEDGSVAVTWKQGTTTWAGYLDDGNTVSRGPGSYEVLSEGPGGGDTTTDSYFFEDNGTPVMGDGGSVPRHGVFPTSYYEYYIGDFGTDQTVQNYFPGEFGDTASGEIKQFHIVVSGYTWVDIVAYDHVVKSNAKIHSVFSPFSHDGGGGVPIPEPMSLVLMGTGLVAGATVMRKRVR